MKLTHWVRMASLAAVVLTTARSYAQDFTLTDLEWVDPNGAPDQLPTVKGRRVPIMPEQIEALKEPAYAEIRQTIDKDGKVLTTAISATNPWLESLRRDPDAYERIAFKRALWKGPGIKSNVRSFLIFNPESAKTRGTEATPRVLKVVAPLNPDTESKKPWTGILTVEAMVDASGKVVKVVADPVQKENFAEAARAAVLKWQFAPARKDGVAVEQAVRVPVLFQAPTIYSAVQLESMPRATKQVKPIYPFGPRRANMVGKVTVQFVINEDGKVQSAEVAESTSAVFNQSALDSVLQWEFVPGKILGIPVKTRMQVPIVFSLNGLGPTRDGYEIERSREVQQRLPDELKYDFPAKVANSAIGVYPFKLLQERVKGSAEAHFIVSPGGRVAKLVKVSGTQPEFERALEAMLDEFRFEPASKDGKPTWGLLRYKVKFERDEADVLVEPSALEILSELKREQPRIATARQIDGPPAPISQRKPFFPTSLREKNVGIGKATIEFFIDEKGFARLPRIISSSEEAFGYSAAQAISTWRFKPVLKDGKPTLVRVTIPVDFKLTNDDEA